MLKDYNTNKQKRKDTRSQSFAPRYDKVLITI